MNSSKKLFRSLWLTFISILLVTLSPANVLAQDITFYGTNDIIYYDPDTCSLDGSTTVGNGTVGSFKNPVVNSNAPDPSVIRGEDGKFYMYTTGFQQFVSDDLVHWKKLNDGINWIKNHPNWSTDHWAPDISKIGNTYVLAISGGSGGTRNIGYATSSSAGGPFTYQGLLVNPADRGKFGSGFDIDPNIIQTDKGIFLYYGSGRGYIKMAKLTQNGDKLSAGRSKTVFTTHHGKGPVLAEGTFVYKHGDYYYLYFSTGQWDKSAGGTPYELHVARSKDPTGGFTEKTEAILKGNDSFTHPGHNSVITDASGTDFIVYHAYPKGKSYRAAMIDKIDYKDDWPVINNGNGPSSGQQAGSSGGSATPSSGSTSSGGQIDVTLAQANVQTPFYHYAKSQGERIAGAVNKFSADDPDFFTLNEIAPNTNSNVGKYKSFKQDYPNAKTNEDSAIRILWDSDRWKKIDGGIEQINPFESAAYKSARKDRYALWATFQNINNGASMSVIAAHWNTRATFSPNHDRAKNQGEKIATLAQTLESKGPVLVAGDFNYRNGAQYLGKSYSPDTTLGAAGLKSAFKPGQGANVDWIFYSDQLSLTSKRAIPNSQIRDLTDHPFIVAKFSGTGGSATGSTTGSCTCSEEAASTDADVPIEGNDNEEKTWNYLTGKGLSPEQAAGIMGNISAESSFDPQAGKGGSHIGISQWDSGGRWAALVSWAHNQHLDEWKFETQLQYMWKEGTDRKNIEGIKKYNDVKKAAWYWGRYFEVAITSGSSDTPLSDLQGLDRRLTDAQKYYEKYNGTTGSSSSASTGSSAGCADATDAVNSGTGSEFSADGMVIYNQEDPRWANKPFGTTGKTIKSSGCGPTSMATIITALTGKSVTPDKTTAYANQKGMYVAGSGASWQLGPVLAEHWGLKSKSVPKSVAKINAELRKGSLIIISGTGASPFTSSGHFITIRGVTDSGKWKIADSNGTTGQSNSKKEWDPNLILGIANNNAVAISK